MKGENNVLYLKSFFGGETVRKLKTGQTKPQKIVIINKNVFI